MMPKFFNHDSPGAPLLTGGTNNNLIQVLKFALIPSGWTLVWEDVAARKACFRNDPNEGTGCYFLVDETPASMAYMDVGEGWDDTSKTLINNVALASPWTRGTYKGASADNRQWWIVADNRTFYAQISGKFLGQPAEIVDGTTSGWYQWPFGAGDYMRFDGKPGVFIAGTWSNTASLPSQSNNSIGVTGYSLPDMNRSKPSIGVTRGADGKIASTCIGALVPAVFNSGYIIGDSSAVVITDNPYLTFSQNYLLYTSNGSANTMGVSGVLRGLWFPNFRVYTTCSGVSLDQTWRSVGNSSFSELMIFAGKDSNSNTSMWYMGVEKGKPW
ncbi:tail assembly protein [Stenotrophomonas maltophilia phage vB_SmaM_Ps15]|uniref:Tail assembly protein n=1 Tax=Stenotrophomonas maltophilia phage vB_SmaM_Ps15 TaxID=3071007 RepID=A0AAE9FLG8_9CAUD|nr:tail assembly protein [Stenotrophomonas maltophilia phage vB_SmaM_Ps15]UMO77180.1 tail assembly protein [Stenotrophomonas maltophilia phage vB_SmaM_Ps15]